MNINLFDTNYLIEDINFIGDLLSRPAILNLHDEDTFKETAQSIWLSKSQGLKGINLGQMTPNFPVNQGSSLALQELLDLEKYRLSSKSNLAEWKKSQLKIKSEYMKEMKKSKTSKLSKGYKTKLSKVSKRGRKARNAKNSKKATQKWDLNNVEAINEIIRAQREQYYKNKGIGKTKSGLSKRKKLWKIIIKKELCKYVRQRTAIRKELLAVAKRASRDCARHLRQRALLSQKCAKDAVSRGKRLSREISVYWRQFERIDKVSKKRADRVIAEQRRADLELLEAKRQQRKLNFLITQTELYAHFMARKVSGNQSSMQTQAIKHDGLTDDEETSHILSRLEEEDEPIEPKKPKLIEDDIYDSEAMKLKALDIAKIAVRKQTERVNNFPGYTEAAPLSQATLSSGSTERVQPSLFQGQLKHYQLKGMNWLLDLFEQGINGILADEMGLGKTIQTMAFFGVLCETFGLWGPFLVVAPTSTLHNWTQEIAKFLPALKIVPYWGTPAERKVLRRYWSSSSILGGGTNSDNTKSGSCEGSGILGTHNASFHVVVTSYQVVRQDVKFLSRINWQYMVLDEAQAIKSTTSQRWNTLLGFNCRNRLLLTGTPIQNTMHELWALLHFIMPTLFDSHEEFNEWFSKDIESQASTTNSSAVSCGDSGLASKLTEQQLARLHMILKPFMLRRVKADVENELSDKIEVLVYCDMSLRQRQLHSQLKRKVSLAELKDVAMTAGSGKEVATNSRARTLFNLVMQLRKVCNHPDLIEKRCVRHVCLLTLPMVPIPKLIFREFILHHVGNIKNIFNIHNAENIYRSLFYNKNSSIFSFTRLIDLSISQLEYIMSPKPYNSNSIPEIYNSFQEKTFERSYLRSLDSLWHTSDNKVVSQMLLMPLHSNILLKSSSLSSLLLNSDLLPCWSSSLMLHIVCQSVRFHVSDSSWGLYLSQISRPVSNVLSWKHRPQIELVDQDTRLADSGKLKALDTMLVRLKKEGHRILIYSQMTKMIDILEDLMTVRQYTYIRLDGSSKLSDRRDLVANFQTRNDIFVFLLSTRAGGLGINLTAADTVIFYDSDWNPTVDQQAMDRAHRLGQTKQVTVYRLICRHSVEERILRRAEEKRAMQRMVIKGGSYESEDTTMATNDTLNAGEVVSLLMDDEEMMTRQNLEWQRKRQDRAKTGISEMVETDDSKFIDKEEDASGDTLLEKLRRDAWAARSRGGGRPKKFRPLDSVGLVSSSRSSTQINNSMDKSVDSPVPGSPCIRGGFLSPRGSKGRGRGRGRGSVPLKVDDPSSSTQSHAVSPKNKRGRGRGKKQSI